jgi:tRNA-dihydrouridine synthase
MIGRAAIGYPWIFNEIKHFMKTGEHLPPPTVFERVEVCKKHLRQSVSWKGDVVGILEMRRHYTNYLKGLPHIKDFRQQLVTCNTLAAVEDVLDKVALHYKDFIIERISPISDNNLLPANNEVADCNVYG